MNDPERRVALALSGGGFRAALFHLGVVRLLYEARWLRSVKQIGAVSGGSILAAHLVLYWDRYTGNDESFDSAARELIQFVQADIRGRVVRRWILAWVTLLPRLLMPSPRRWTFTNLLQSYYTRLFRNASLKQLYGPGRPYVIFNCTSMSTGSPCSFSSSDFIWYENDQEKSLAAPDTPVAFAVAASSAFPPLFPPIAITNETLFCDRSQFPEAHYLSDGGLYDNLGIDRLVRQQRETNRSDFLLVSDAEGSFDWEFESRYTFLVSRNVRASDLLMTRVSSLQFNNLPVQKHSFVRVGIKDAIIDPDDQTLLSPEIQRSLSKVRTDLDRFSDKEVTALIAHGYNKARYELIKHGCLDTNAPKFSWSPLDNWLDLQSRKSAIELRKSSRRTWGLWSFRDWASWATAAFIGLLVGGAVWTIIVRAERELQLAKAEAAREASVLYTTTMSRVEAEAFQLCIGEYKSECPPEATHLDCGSSVEEWAKEKQCKDFSAREISSREGNKCGYSIVQGLCTTRVLEPLTFPGRIVPR